jgi:hypothetical protein
VFLYSKYIGACGNAFTAGGYARPWLTATAGAGGLANISGSATVQNANGCTEYVDVAPGAPKEVSVAVKCDAK